MKKPKPIIKLNNGRQHLTSWIVDNFPNDYRDLEYCDMCCGSSLVFLSKQRSVREILNDQDVGICAIYRSIRDDPKELQTRLKRLRYSDKAFEKAVRRATEEPFTDYVDQAVNELVLRRYSKHGKKKIFEPGGEKRWQAILGSVPLLSQRLQGVVVLNRSFQELIKVWGEAGMLLYLATPALPLVINGIVKMDHDTLPVEEHVKFLNHINNTKAKVVISGYYNSLYRRHLIKWRCLRKKAPNQKIKDRKYDCLWINY